MSPPLMMQYPMRGVAVKFCDTYAFKEKVDFPIADRNNTLGLDVAHDGLSLFTAGTGTSPTYRLEKYLMVSPFNVSSANFSAVLNTGGFLGGNGAATLKAVDSGNSIFIGGVQDGATSRIVRLVMSSPYSLSVASSQTFVLDGVRKVIRALDVSPNGSKLFVVAANGSSSTNNDILYEYNINTFNIVAPVYSGLSLNPDRFVNNSIVHGVKFSPNGSQFLISLERTGTVQSLIDLYACPVPFSLSGAFFVKNLIDASAQAASGTIRDIAIDTDLQRIYAMRDQGTSLADQALQYECVA